MLTVVWVLVLGFFAVHYLARPLFGMEVPDWTDDMGIYFTPLVGGQMLLDSFVPNSPQAMVMRVLGVLLLVLGIFSVARVIAVFL